MNDKTEKGYAILDGEEFSCLKIQMDRDTISRILKMNTKRYGILHGNTKTDIAYYICQTYNQLGKDACTNYKIEARDLYSLVLTDIQELAALALKDADSFYQRLSSRMERRYMADASEMQKEREHLEKKNQEIDDMFLNLYTDKAKGILTEQRFMKLTSAIEQEQESNRGRLQELTLMMCQSDEQESHAKAFIQEIRQYATIEELDGAVLNKLISRIVVTSSF